MTPAIDPIAAHAGTRSGHLALADLASGLRWTYAALDVEVNRYAAWLAGELGGASGARVVLLMRNCAEMIILQHACSRAGAIFVPLNWRLASAEIEALLADAGPSLMIGDPEFATPGAIRTLTLADVAARLPAPGARPPADARRDFDATTTLLYTSGTSGRPKGVMISEANAFWGATNLMHGNGVTGDSVFLVDVPLFHTAGLFGAARPPILAGGTALISAGFEAPITLGRLADPALGVTHYFSVPQIAQVLWNTPGFDPAMLRALKVMPTGGAPNPAAQVERFVRAGIPMSDGFGMSETGSNFGTPVNDPTLMIAKAGSCGKPYIAIAARIVDDEGRDVVEGEVGELWLAGPSITAGYWNQPELTAAAFTDGWFRTGDAARRDSDGYYWLVDRKKDMYISGGENVYPAEVEAVLAEWPGVAEAAVIGVPDPRWGETGRAYIIAAPGKTVSTDDLEKHCRSRLARFKVPATVVLTDAIPRTASGKVQKHVLRERAKGEMGG